jgi:N-acetylglucosaminyldiphosphoundecaprenol N-acetyl-beta-D-mannosaminyltransferase
MKTEAASVEGRREALPCRLILGMRVDATNYVDAVGRLLGWARRGESRYSCVASMHMVMVAYDSVEFRSAVNGADLVTPDGMALVWGLRLLGIPCATRVYGPELTPRLLEGAARLGLSVGFHGGSPNSLARLLAVCAARWPDLQVVYAASPPFRPQTRAEDEADVAEINRSGVRLLLVGLGCPKQERWMSAHAGRVRGVMVGVGAAFDFIAGEKPQAPPWMQRACLEWLFRLCTEPRRLWRRYLGYGPRFVALFARQLIAGRAGGAGLGHLNGGG